MGRTKKSRNKESSSSDVVISNGINEVFIDDATRLWLQQTMATDGSIEISHDDANRLWRQSGQEDHISLSEFIEKLLDAATEEAIMAAERKKNAVDAAARTQRPLLKN